MQLILLRAADNPELLKWIQRKSNKYTSLDMQNELLKVMALTILRGISATVQSAKFFKLMADGVFNVANKEQVAICLRFVDDDFEPHEQFIGMHIADSIESVFLLPF